MRPNIFIANSNCAEDSFSHGLAYVLSLFPEIGERITNRIAVLSGRSPGYFGSFQSCEFIAHEYLEGHEASRPDICFTCRRRTIYFENKLDAPLSVAQMRRHSELVRRTENGHLMFVSNINHRCPALRSIPRYLRPRGRDHFLWVDLFPALESPFRVGSHAARVLGDFGEALKLHGILGRTIHGADGSLYTPGSRASDLALDQLSPVLRDAGFRVARRHPGEATLRVYPKQHREYPLLNPRFYATASWLDRSLDFEALVVSILSRGKNLGLDRALDRLRRKSTNCIFVPDRRSLRAGGYTFHGHFVLPVTFAGRGTGSSIKFPALIKPLETLCSALTLV